MIFIKPTDGRVRQVILNTSFGPANITAYVQCLRVYETLCKPYLTAKLVLVDNDNIIDNLGIIGGEGCSISFDSYPNQFVYSLNVSVLSLSGHQSPSNLKTQIYDMDLIGQAYYNDKSNIVQKSFWQQGTAAIGEIWGQYLAAGDAGINIPHGSDGMMGKNDQPSTIDHKKPFAAIDQIRKLLKFGGTSAPTVFYRDRDKANLVPLNDLFGAGVEHYVQKETWGADLYDKDIYRVIIAAEADVDKNFNGEGSGGRSSTQGIAKAGVQGQAVFDLFKGVPIKFTQAAAISGASFGAGTSSIGSLLQGTINTIAGGLGGAPNIQATNSNRWDRANAPDTKAMAEQVYAAEARNGPQLKLKVPLQTGLNVTVGQNITVSLIPPVGDALNYNISKYSMSGDWLVKDLMHELYTDDRNVKCTTVFQCIRGGFNF